MDYAEREILNRDFEKAKVLAEEIEVNHFNGVNNGVIMLVIAILLAQIVSQAQKSSVENRSFEFVEKYARHFVSQFRKLRQRSMHTETETLQ